ncbi:hypothetical protein V6N11_027165 [Hibiscus sabdariffa]|uniref:Uncharacterized protein n=1 Tax=Hibiscus sabdariffa TaxID=183260 RepID=A0ABR2PG55_9ROSI
MISRDTATLHNIFRASVNVIFRNVMHMDGQYRGPLLSMSVTLRHFSNFAVRDSQQNESYGQKLFLVSLPLVTGRISISNFLIYLIYFFAGKQNADRSDKSSVVDKGHFVVYTMDKKRYVIPLAHLKNSIFQELFKMSEEFRLSCNGPITLLWMKPVLRSITDHGCSSYTTNVHEGHAEKQSLVCGLWIKKTL